MSLHLLDCHRENIIKENSNEKALEECIKYSSPYIRIAIRNNSNEREYYFVSFGYMSGWKNEPTYKTSKEKANDNKQRHLVVCTELLKELRIEKEKRLKGDLSAEDRLRNEVIAKKYTEEVEKHNKTKQSLKTARTTNDKYMDVLEIIKRLYKLNSDEIYTIEEMVGDIYRTYSDDDSRTRRARDDVLDDITLESVKEKWEEIKRESAAAAADGDW